MNLENKMLKKIKDKNSDEYIIVDLQKKAIVFHFDRKDIFGWALYVYLYKEDVEKNRDKIKGFTVGQVEFQKWVDGKPHMKYRCEISEEHIEYFVETTKNYPVSKSQKEFHTFPNALLQGFYKKGYKYLYPTRDFVSKLESPKNSFVRRVLRPHEHASISVWKNYALHMFIEDWIHHFEQKYIAFAKDVIASGSAKQNNKGVENLLDIFFFMFFSIYRTKRYFKMIEIKTGEEWTQISDIGFYGIVLPIIEGKTNHYTDESFEDFFYKFNEMHVSVMHLKIDLPLSSNPIMMLSDKKGKLYIVNQISPNIIAILSNVSSMEMHHNIAKSFVADINKYSQFLLSNNAELKPKKIKATSKDVIFVSTRDTNK